MDKSTTSSRRLPSDRSSPASEDEFFARKKRRVPMFDQMERYLLDDSEHLSGLAAPHPVCQTEHCSACQYSLRASV